MPSAMSPHWPAHLSSKLTVPATNLFYNAEVSAARFPDKPFLSFYGKAVTFAQFKDQAVHMAGFLQRRCGIAAGERVIIFMQNCPQWAIAFYAALRANAVVVPVNPMNTTEELRHYIEDSGARAIFVAQELFPRLQPLLNEGVLAPEQCIVVTYSDYLSDEPETVPPEFVLAPRHRVDSRVPAWSDALAARLSPGALLAGPNDLCVIPYTSGTTGKPKGCMHTHYSVMCTAVGGAQWFASSQDVVQLAVLPLFHVTGMQGGMNAPLYNGATVVMLARWDRDAAASAIERHRIAGWHAMSTMVVDFLSNPRLGDYDISSLRWMRGGGAAMPEALANKLKEKLGVGYIEGYGMSETIAATHFNPAHRPKPQCLGIPVFDVDARIVDPATLVEIPRGETGEIVICAPQVMQGYWRNPEATREVFVEIDGRWFLRTGDLGRVDEEGYYFMTDRLKRMINVSGYKVWPAEVEAQLYHHPLIQEACVIATRDSRRGETVKALVVLDARRSEEVRAEDIIDWARTCMASYKVPRIVEFVGSLPKSASGKVLWRQLQDAETSRESTHADDSVSRA
ncbi:long-chain fatty acid--CoA ligase [Paraburkholderia pallida]|uniref:Long-chain fatty acid--CoA ligase n=1 Tax=Paraburkholderia pallida TaxID=2547399 RepID=A0A4P7D4Y8_9BURK|nr:long-chain fatty acid--CoA ligase [Paraburkholderia pallida]QBR03881.1 long-chain fatty acid--CoA ligase [Paraburkholderia pallida]